MKAATLWPAAVIGALVVTVGANIVMFILANDSQRAVVEPHYYERAVAWDSTMAEATRSQATGWSATATLSPASDPGRAARLDVRIVDRGGLALDGAMVQVEAIHNLDPAGRVHAALTSRGNGDYEADLPLRHTGLWELRILADRGADHFRCDLRRDLPASEHLSRHGAP